MGEKQKRSKKQSATKAELLLRGSWFFIDSCLGRSLRNRLHALDFNAIHHDELFDEGTEDVVWIPAVAALGFVILTKDKAIRKESAEMQAVIVSRAIMFTYPKGNYSVDVMEEVFVQHQLAIGRMLKNTPAPLIASISKNGVALRYPESEKPR
jgi:predicted nuclease of predicted toxin-antitoxin system